MSDVRFFARVIWSATLCAFGWLVTFVLTGKWWASSPITAGRALFWVTCAPGAAH